MYCPLGVLTVPDESLAQRVYAYFIWRLRQPADAERLTRLTFQRVWQEEGLSRDVAGEPDIRLLAAARAVISENPRPRGATRVGPSRLRNQRGRDAPVGLSDQLALAMGKLHGRERDALALRFGAELSIGEIAELIDRTPADVKQRLARGVRDLISLGVLRREEDGSGKKSAAERSRTRGAEQGKAKDQAADEE